MSLMRINLVLFIAALCYFSPGFAANDVQRVIASKVYRSGALDRQALTKAKKNIHFNSLINLCSAPTNTPLNKAEFAFAADQQHLHYYQLEFSETKAPSQHLLRILAQRLMQAPQPLLLHCHTNTNITSLGAAITLILFDKTVTQQKLLAQFTEKSGVGKQVINNYFVWLKQHKKPLNKSSFLTWLSQ